MSLDDMPPTITAAKAASARKSAATSIDGEKRGMFAPGRREPAAVRRLDVALARVTRAKPSPRCRQFPYMSKLKYFAWIVL